MVDCPHLVRALLIGACPVLAGVQELNAQLQQWPLPAGHFGEWRTELEGVNAEFPLSYPARNDVIMPQWAIEVGTGAVLPEEGFLLRLRLVALGFGHRERGHK